MLDAKVLEKTPFFKVDLIYFHDHQEGGSLRFCCDFRNLDKIPKPIAYQMPNIEELLSLLGGGGRQVLYHPRC